VRSTSSTAVSVRRHQFDDVLRRVRWRRVLKFTRRYTPRKSPSLRPTTVSAFAANQQMR
jgi:hypothetical protein